MTTATTTAAPIPSAAAPALGQARLLLGLAGLIAWLLGFAVIEIAHDQMLAEPPVSPVWFLSYEIAGGYVLGFVTALAFEALGRLVRGQTPEMFPEAPWLRWFAVVGLVVVIVSCLAGAVMHNFGGLTLTYDIAFLVALAVVWTGVLPIYRQLSAGKAQ